MRRPKWGRRQFTAYLVDYTPATLSYISGNP
jgi:hypothetical protein